MAQLVVRKLDDEVKRRLQLRAVRHGRSMEDEVRDILHDAVKDENEHTVGLGTEIAALFADIELDFDIPEWRGFTIEPPTFD